MSTTREWKRQATTYHKEWGEGEWQNEPDKVQWIDEATGLNCLAVRNWSGAWCGYVGVDEKHPLYAKDYGACVRGCEPDETGYTACYDHRPEGLFSVHGGLTFSAFCHEPTREEWQRLVNEQLPKAIEHSKTYPEGDGAEFMKEWAPVIGDYETFRAKAEAQWVCHIPNEGEGRVWWFGFDCAHGGLDIVPGMEERFRQLGLGSVLGGDRQYRNFAYLKAECAHLAKQLSEYVSGADQADSGAAGQD